MFKKIIAAAILLLSFKSQAAIVLNPDNTVNLRGVIDGNSMTTAALKLIELHKKRGRNTYTIYLVLDSPGGSIMAGVDFINLAKTVPNVETISIFAASMASAIVESLPGKRHIVKDGILMFHRAKGGFEGQFETGEVESRLAIFKEIVRGMEIKNATRMGISLEAYKAKVVNEYWLSAETALKDNAVDTVQDIICTLDLIDKREVAVQNFGFMSGKALYSACPLLRRSLTPATEDDEESEEEDTLTNRKGK